MMTADKPHQAPAVGAASSSTAVAVVTTAGARAKILGDRFIRVKGVAELVGLSTTTVYKLAKKDPTFPQPMRVGQRMNVWSRNDVLDWIESIKASK